jgi:hypothetical protein
MTDGAASLMTMFYGLHAAGLHKLERGTNLLDSGSAIYETTNAPTAVRIDRADRAEIPRGACSSELGLPYTTDDGVELRGKLETLFKTRTRDEWCALLEGNGCLLRAGSLDGRSAATIRTTSPAAPSSKIDGVVQPGPAPRFSRGRLPAARPPHAAATRSAKAWGIPREPRRCPRRRGALRPSRIDSAVRLRRPWKAEIRKRNAFRQNERARAISRARRGSCSRRRARCAAAVARKPLSILERSREMCTSITLVCGSK